MALLADHIRQANHNQECAKFMLGDTTMRDWAITAAFYSAIHFVEAGFTTIAAIEHSETTPHARGGLGKFRNSYRDRDDKST